MVGRWPTSLLMVGRWPSVFVRCFNHVRNTGLYRILVVPLHGWSLTHLYSYGGSLSHRSRTMIGRWPTSILMVGRRPSVFVTVSVYGNRRWWMPPRSSVHWLPWIDSKLKKQMVRLQQDENSQLKISEATVRWKFVTGRDDFVSCTLLRLYSSTVRWDTLLVEYF